MPSPLQFTSREKSSRASEQQEAQALAQAKSLDFAKAKFDPMSFVWNYKEKTKTPGFYLHRKLQKGKLFYKTDLTMQF